MFLFFKAGYNLISKNTHYSFIIRNSMKPSKIKSYITKHLQKILIITGLILIGISLISIILEQQKKTALNIGQLAIDQEGFLPLVVEEENEDQRITRTADPQAFIPDRIVIPTIDLDAPIVFARKVTVKIEQDFYSQFLVPEEFAAGWLPESAPLGEIGNTVISGHHNAFGKVFADLNLLDEGDKIKLYSGEQRFDYVIGRKMILEERDVGIAQQLENARWLLPTEDERITLVTCWPADSNTHRLILVAVPLEQE